MKYYLEKLPLWQKWIKSAGILFLLLAIVLSPGCASHPPADIIQPWPGTPPIGYSMVMMYWTKTRWGQGGGGPTICIDGTETFKLRVNHYTWLYVRSGRHTLSTSWGFKILGWNPVSGLNMKKDITFADGESYYLRMRVWASGGPLVEKTEVLLDQVGEQTAKDEARPLWYRKPEPGQFDGRPNHWKTREHHK